MENQSWNLPGTVQAIAARYETHYGSEYNSPRNFVFSPPTVRS